jgi:Mannosyltransferase (PIG-V)
VLTWNSLRHAPMSMAQRTFDLVVPQPAARPAVASASRTQALPWRAVVPQAVAMWVATRVVLILFTYFSILQKAGTLGARGNHYAIYDLLTSWNHWDGLWYTNIAAKGYWTAQSSAFFPLYPLAIRALSIVAGKHWLADSMIVSNLGTLGAFVALGLLGAVEDGTKTSAWRTILLAAAYPLAFFLAAPYSEGLFLAFAVGCLVCMRRGSWAWAALWAFLSALTRPLGAVLILPMLWEYGRQHEWWSWARWRADGWRRTGLNLLRDARLPELALILGAVPLAIGLYALYLWHRFGQPLLFLHVQSTYWHRVNMPPWLTIPAAIHQELTNPALTYWQVRPLLDLGPVLIFLVLTLVCARRLPFAFTLYMLGLIYVATMSPVVHAPGNYPDMLMSAGRFMTAAAPMFLVLGRWTARYPWLDILVVGGGFMLQALLLICFFTYGWIL